MADIEQFRQAAKGVADDFDINRSLQVTSDIISQYEDAFIHGDYKMTKQLINSNFNFIIDTIGYIQNCFKNVDADDESGYREFWQNILQNVALAYRSRDVFLQYDIVCYDLKDGIEQFISIIGE